MFSGRAPSKRLNYKKGPERVQYGRSGRAGVGLKRDSRTWKEAVSGDSSGRTPCLQGRLEKGQDSLEWGPDGPEWSPCRVGLPHWGPEQGRLV